MDLIDDGVNGYLVDVGDTHGLAQRLISVLELPERPWQKMSEAAYVTARGFTWEHATALFERALEVAIERCNTAGTRLPNSSRERNTAPPESRAPTRAAGEV
jgi:hypothetical protein